ncbi:hypothetical protein [Paraburkholderia xenovorans]|uniref:hypothetical protein n=1 Tax=Paraburkholderia xenovorans TaxID=36873 RepID=UPI0038B83ABB
MDVSQPLLFRYSECWEDLFDAVFDKVFSGLWCGEWSSLLCDLSRPSRERLITSTTSICQWLSTGNVCACTYLLVFRTLASTGYFRIVEQRFLRLFCAEVRAEFVMIGADARPTAFASEVSGVNVLAKDLLRLLVGAFVETTPRAVASLLE